MTQIELRGVEKFFGSLQVIRDLNLVVDHNEFIVLLGPAAIRIFRDLGPAIGS